MENIERRNSIKNEEIDGALVENELTDVIPIEELEEEFFSDCEPGPSSRIFIKKTRNNNITTENVINSQVTSMLTVNEHYTKKIVMSLPEIAEVIDSSNILSYIGTTEEIRDMLSNLTKISEPVLKKFFPEKSLKFNKQFERTFDEFMKNTGQNIAEGFLTAKSKDNLTFLELMEKNNGNVQLWDVVSFSLDQFYKTTLGEFFLKNHIDTEMIMNILKEINNLIPLVDLSSTIYASAKNLVETFRMVYDLVGSVDAFLNDLKKKKVRK